jgi:hypothetical protein
MKCFSDVEISTKYNVEYDCNIQSKISYNVVKGTEYFVSL